MHNVTTERVPACRKEEGQVYAIDLGGTNFRVVAFQFGCRLGQAVSGIWSGQLGWQDNGATINAYKGPNGLITIMTIVKYKFLETAGIGGLSCVVPSLANKTTI